MLESPAVQEDKNVEENIAKNVRNLLRLKKEQHYTTIKDINNFFRLEKELKQLTIEYLEILRIFFIMRNTNFAIHQ